VPESLEFTFPKSKRLLKTDEISSVFNFRCQSSGETFQALARPNGLGHARLAVVVSRKTSRRAVVRNYIKRAVREYFRRQQHELPALDIVVRARSRFDRTGRPGALAELQRHFGKLQKCLAYSS
jgi:ribonuclease P protein component